MKRNEKILASALGLIAVGYFGWPMIDSMLLAPVRTLEEQADKLRSDVSKARDETVQLKVAERQLEGWKQQGLPGNPLDAQRLYQQWLIDLAVTCGLDLSAVTSPNPTTQGGIYATVRVDMNGQGRFEELQTFLRLCHDADLLHRISAFNTKNVPAAEGDPEISFLLTAEGLNAIGAPARTPLFPQHELADALPADAKSLKVAKKQLPARVGDLVRIGKEFVEVVETKDDQLGIKRGVAGTTAAEHPAGAVAELLPLTKESRSGKESAFAKIDNPFVKPRKYEPNFDGFADQKLERGKSLQLSPKVADYNRAAGTPKLELKSGPEGLKFDAAKGEITWTPAADLPSGDYKVSLAADLPAPHKRLEKTITISLVDPNTPPKLDPISPAEVFLGETLKLPLKATDAQDGSSLTYKVDQGPEGTSVDSAKNEFVWAVPQSFAPGEVNITIVAADKGTPPLEAKQTFAVKVREDLRPFVYMTYTGSETVQGKKTWNAWLTDRSSGRTLHIYEGKAFEAAGLTGVVKEIGADFVTFERNKQLYKILLGQNLKDAKKVGEPVADATPAAPAEAKKPASDEPTPATAATEAAPAS
jgi:ribosomal protein L12E/L44/L45/RPP1/RPP2